ncbi:MAG TPA: adenylate/guanylate cyclase domain-containing protein [Acidimicrobiales bacterium]|nr:adenylate/guanylate cyclase domain-containing protein [Acidimicrobiales bacterium]
MTTTDHGLRVPHTYPPAVQCPSCSAEVPAGARFCSSCGHALFAPADERRVVTVLFADLVGFTSLSEKVDPEHVKNIVDRCFERLAADIGAYGGRVDKIVGDAVVALFGAPVAHEDDAERAVRAGLEMQRSLADQAAAIGADLRMRIGINTGEVLVGALRAGGDYTAMGDVVNTASRLQTNAAAGQVVVGEETYLATANVFRYESLGLLTARGREEQVRAWVAHEALTAPGRRPRRSESPLVGRDGEVELLCSAFRTGINYRRPHLALLVGEAGMGKSRLAEHVVANVASSERCLVLVGRSRPYGEANVWWPIADALRGHCGIAPTHDAAEARARCLHAVASALGEVESADVARTADALLYLMGYEGRLDDVEPARARGEIHAGMRAFLEGLASQHPTLLVISDVQWADELVLELVDSLLERLHRIPLVVLLTARPELEQRWRPTPGRHNLVVLNLDPLDDDATGEMLTSLLGRDVDQRVREALIERSGGNPLFLEELVAILAESGDLEKGADRVSSLPATLRGLVAARLDALPSGERAVLEDAAVVGRRGPVAALVALGQSRGAAGTVRAAVDALVAKDLLDLDEVYVEFVSDLVREVAYGTLTKAERARRHAAVGAWVESIVAETERSDEFLDNLARHYATSAELTAELGGVVGVPDDLTERALEALERAADRAEDRELHMDALRSWDQMLRILGDEASARRRHALVGRGRARMWLRRNAEARADLDMAVAEATDAGDRLAVARARTVEGELLRNEGRYEESLAVLEEALALWRELGDRRGEASALRRMGMTHLFSGDHDIAEPLLLDALHAFQDIGSRKGVAWANQNLAWIAFLRGESDVAEERLERAESMFDDIGDWGGLGWARGLLAWVYFTRGMLREAEELASKQIAEAEESGDRWALGMMTVLLASAQHWQGNINASVEALEHARQIFMDIGDHWGQLRAIVPLARGLQAIGQREEAELLLVDAEAIVDHYPSGSNERLMPAFLGTELAIQRGDGKAALDLMDRAFEAARTEWDPTSPGGGENVVNRALALSMVGRVADAVPLLRSAAGLVRDVGPSANVLSAYALVLAAAGDVEGARAQAARVAALDGGTYLDHATALMAESCAAAAAGDVDGALAALDATDQRVSPTDDDLVKAIAQLARARVLAAIGSPGADEVLAVAGAALAALAVDAQGWDAVFLAATGPVRPAS